MKQYLIGAGVAAAVLIIGLGVFFAVRYNYNVQKGRVYDRETQGQVSPDATSDLPILSTNMIGNFVAFEEGVKSDLLRIYYDGSKLAYKMYIDRLHRFEFNGYEIYLGAFNVVFGNGVAMIPPQPVFVLKGNLYIAGNDGTTLMNYPSSNGQSYGQFENLTYTTKSFMPADQMGLYYSSSSFEQVKQQYAINRAVLGIDGLVINYNEAGDPIKVVLTNTDGKKFVSTKPGEKLQPISVAIFPENSSTVDYVTQNAKNRAKPGFTSGNTSVISRYGYKITYPNTLNGQKVTYDGWVFDSGEEQAFIAERVSDNPEAYIEGNIAKIFCSDQNRDVKGEKTGTPYLIATSSRKNLVDWGTTSFGSTDEFTFSTPHASCYMSVSGAFRLNMFTIELID